MYSILDINIYEQHWEREREKECGGVRESEWGERVKVSEREKPPLIAKWKGNGRLAAQR